MANFSAVGSECVEARNQATIAFADTGAAKSHVDIFDVNGTLLVSIVLTKPCGTLANGKIVLTQQSQSGDLIAADGVAASAAWISAAGLLVASGDVTGSTGAGPFIVEGSGGAGSVQLYAGGRAILGATEIS